MKIPWPVPGPDGGAALVGQINHISAYKKSLRRENFSQKQQLQNLQRFKG